jgi:hypothetical protein
VRGVRGERDEDRLSGVREVPGEEVPLGRVEIADIQDRRPQVAQRGRNCSSTSVATSSCWDRSSARQALSSSAGVRPSGPRLRFPFSAFLSRPPIRFIANSS